MLARAHMPGRDTTCCYRKESGPTQLPKLIAAHSALAPDSSCPAPLAPGSRAATMTASVYPAETACLSPALEIPLAPHRRPWQKQMPLRSPPPDSPGPASKTLPRSVALPRNHRTPLAAAPRSPAKVRHSPCCPPARQIPPPASSSPEPSPHDPHMLQYRRPEQIPNSRNPAWPRTTAAVPPLRPDRNSKTPARREHSLLPGYPAFVPAPRESLVSSRRNAATPADNSPGSRTSPHHPAPIATPAV